MQDLKGKTAVITGGASGIGLAMAERFARAGMRIALADVEELALELAAERLRAGGTEVLALSTDVTEAGSMDELGARVHEFGGADLVCLNAGVSGGGGLLETLTTEDWAWGIGVNLWGVIHGLRVFLRDLKARGEGHVVITSSVAGLTCFANAGPYHATKHAVAAIAQVLFRELHEAGSAVGVSCLCPGLVSTNFPSSDRNRPEALKNPGAEDIPAEQAEALRKAVGEIFARGASPDHVAECVYDAVVNRQFWVLTDDVHPEVIKARHRSIENATDPPTDGGPLDGY